MVDKDGNFRLSNNVVVDRTSAGIENIYPIPASSALNIQLMTLSRENMKIDVLDLSGRPLGYFHKSLEKGRHTVSIPVSNLPRGQYMVKIHRANSTTAHPFMKQ
jgi:hypothetical protein